MKEAEYGQKQCFVSQVEAKKHWPECDIVIFRGSEGNEEECGKFKNINETVCQKNKLWCLSAHMSDQMTVVYMIIINFVKILQREA